MNTALLQQVAEHYQRREFDQCILLADQGIGKDRADLAMRYCSAMAHLCIGDVSTAVGQFFKMLETYQIFKSQGYEVSQSTLRILGYSALQMALIVEFYWFEMKNALLLQKALFARTLAHQIGKEIQDTGLQDSVFVNQHYKQWVRAGISGQKSQGLWYVPPSPYVLQVELTNQCNLACRMCPRGILTRKQGMMDMRTWEQVLDTWSYRERILELPHLIFQGAGVKKPVGGRMKLYFMGESLLHPQFDTCIRTARERGIQVIVQTNGVVLSDAALRERILKAQPAAISFSIDGISKASYEYVRKGSSWDRLLGAIQALHSEREQQGLRNAIQMIAAMIIPEYTQRLADIPEDIQAFIAPLKPYMDEIGIKGLSRQSDGEFVDRAGNPISYSTLPDTPPSMDQPLCPEIMDKMNILWDGTAIPCCYDIDGTMPFGTVIDGVDTVWQNNRFNALRTALLHEDVREYLQCQRCKGYVPFAANGRS